MKIQLRLFYFCTSILAFGSLISCSTTRAPRPASVYLLNTQKPQVELMTEVNKMLLESKYKVKNFNAQTGFLVTEPRAFKVQAADGSAVQAAQTVIIRQEGGSVTVRATYECQYPSHNSQPETQACYKDDAEANSKIRKIEAILLKKMRAKLDGASTAPKEKDLTVESSGPPTPKSTPAPQPPPQ